MNHEPSMADLAVRLTQQHVLSARPDAPTVAERPGRRLVTPLRTALAAHVRRLTRRTGPRRHTPVMRPETRAFDRSNGARIQA